MQIRSRLTFQFLLIVAGMLLAALVFIHFQFRRYLQEEYYDSLRSKALMTAEMLLNKTEPLAPLAEGTETSGGLGSGSENITIYNAAFERVFRFFPASDTIRKDALRDIVRQKEMTLQRGEYASLGMLYTNPYGQAYVIVADGKFNPAHLQSLTGILIISFFLMLAIVALSGWFFAGQSLAPVTRIMNQIDEILPSDLSKRLDQTRHADELSRLVRAFNNMLDRIQHVFKNQKLFLSNISHELKNSLSVIRSQVEIILDKERSGEEYRDTLESVLDDISELGLVTDKLMQLAKINADDSQVVFGSVRIDELIWQARATLLKAHPDYRIVLDMDEMPEDVNCLVVSGNETLLRTALFNLMENGCKFSPEGEVRVVMGQTPEGSLKVEICDSGPGISEDELALVFEPFYRGKKAASVKGSGIGLSLVESILRLHQVSMRVTSKINIGTTFSLEFPHATQLT